MSVKVQMNVIFGCDNPKCGDDLHCTGFFPLNASNQEIFEEVIYNTEYSRWRMVRKSGKLYCSLSCEEDCEVSE